MNFPFSASVQSTPSRARRQSSTLAIGLFGLLALSGCATSSPAYHNYIMQGQVLAVDNKTLTVCIGTRDGARVGEVLNVVRHVRRSAAPKATAPDFRREPVGSARIVNVFDEHYATAEILDGQPQVNDVAELKSH